MRHWKLNDGSDVIMDEVRGQGQGLRKLSKISHSFALIFMDFTKSTGPRGQGQGLEYKDFIRGQQHWVTVKNGLLADVNK